MNKKKKKKVKSESRSIKSRRLTEAEGWKKSTEISFDDDYKLGSGNGSFLRSLLF
jgi:hypothetical protein